MKKVTYLEVVATKVIDRSTKDGELAWEELTDHHAIPFVKGGRYPLSRYWLGYSDDPYENLNSAKQDWGAEWTNGGMLGKVVADYILKKKPKFDAWDTVLIHVDW